MDKICAIGEKECNEILSLYHRKTENLSEEKEGMGEREKLGIGIGTMEAEANSHDITLSMLLPTVQSPSPPKYNCFLCLCRGLRKGAERREKRQKGAELTI